MPDNYPNIQPENTSWSRVSNTQIFTSPFNKASQTIGLSGSLWKTTLNYDTLTEEEFNILDAFVTGLRGMAGRCYLSPHHYKKTGFSSVITATNSGVTLTLNTGVPALNVGALISINHELKKIIAKTSDTVFTVDQPFSQVYTNELIELNSPDCLMMLTSDEFKADFRPPLFQSTSLEFIEAISV